MKIIPITCQGQKYLPIDQLKTFQGNLKELSEDEFEKLKRSILKYGFSFPVFVWQEFMMDGHQRIFTVNKLLQEGYAIGNIPVVEIEARDKTEAAEKLLVLDSRYAKITEDGLSEFANEKDLDFGALVDDLELPDFDMDGFLDNIDNATIKDVESEGSDSDTSRDIGNKIILKPILYSDHVDIFEKAILSTGRKNRALALLDICQHYLDTSRADDNIF